MCAFYSAPDAMALFSNFVYRSTSKAAVTTSCVMLKLNSPVLIYTLVILSISLRFLKFFLFGQNIYVCFLFSSGRDGFVLQFRISLNKQGGDHQLQLRHVRSFSCSPISHVESFSFARESLVATGFRSTEFLVWDLHSQYEVLRLECGGRKRPNDCAMSLNASVRFMNS